LQEAFPVYRKVDIMKFLIITGMSGAGKSLALDHFEDRGFFCVDNLPPALITKFADLCQRSSKDKIAVVSDIRGRDFFQALYSSLKELDEEDFKYEILFLNASDETLVRRFKETRRRHPLKSEGRLLDAIEKEREMLDELKGRASLVLDTSELSVNSFQKELDRYYAVSDNGYPGMSIAIISFGFKYGLPLDADSVFDVRFMPNPHYVDSLREKTGEQQEVQEYIFQWPVANKFYNKFFPLMKFLLPEYIKEGKSHLLIAIGCTGGKHRSVASALRLRDFLTSQGYRVNVEHRDINK